MISLKQATSLLSTHVTIMLLVAFVLPITSYQTNQQLESELRTSRKKNLRPEERNISVDTRKFKNAKYIIIIMYSFLKREKAHSLDHKDSMQNALARQKYKVNQRFFIMKKINLRINITYPALPVPMHFTW